MANYEGFFRTNYFRVKDNAAFERWVDALRLTRYGNGDDRYCVLKGDYHEGGIPSTRYDAESDEIVDADFVSELATHLADGEVAIVIEIGYEKMRYLVGYAVAVNSAGVTKTVDLNAIYEVAKELGPNVTIAEY